MAATAASAINLPSAWVEAIRRHAVEPRAQSLLIDAHRYLAAGSPERVPVGREAETLKNLVHVHLQPAEREGLLYELAVLSLLASQKTVSGTGAGLFVLGSAAVLGLALVRSKR